MRYTLLVNLVYFYAMQKARMLLLPLSIIYGSIVFFRNKLYDWKIIKSRSFQKPVVVIGNLSLGGTGKTPHTQFLVNLLMNEEIKPATLSRGYGRNSKGFITVESEKSALEVGDEPLMIKKRFPEIQVYVGEHRCDALKIIFNLTNSPDVVLLDDAFQHRAVNGKINILITDYNSPYYYDYLIPAGNLREHRVNAKRAHIIIVSKCPHSLNTDEQNGIIKKINPNRNQEVFFTTYTYGTPTQLKTKVQLQNASDVEDVVCVTGIAKPKPLVEYLNTQYKNVVHLNYTDHHIFSKADINHIHSTFEKIKSKNKIIVTTEKDAMRLKDNMQIMNTPLYYIPINVEFLKSGDDFKTRFLSLLRK